MKRARDERGGVFLMVGLMSMVLLLIAAFAVDIGMQRVARRDMQALADAVALDLARLVDGRKADAIKSGGNGKSSLAAALTDSVDRNDDTTLGSAPVVTAILIELDDVTGLPVRNVANQVVEVAATDKPDAVLVSASTSVKFAFSSGSGGAARTAIGQSASNACFRLGSFVASVRSGNSSLLNELLGDALDVTAVSYSGLVNADVTIGGLATQLGAATPSQLMTVNTTFRNLVKATADALRPDGTFASEVAILDQLRARNESRLDTQIALSDLFDLSTASTAALSTKISVLDLISAAALAFNEDVALETGVIWNLPAVSNAEIKMRVSESPRLACGEVGRATATTGQLQYSTSLEYSRGANLVTGLAFESSPQMTINVDVARATGLLSAVDCGEGTAGDPEGMTVLVNRAAPIFSANVPVQVAGSVGSERLMEPLNAASLGALGFSATDILSILDLNSNKIKVVLDLDFNLTTASGGGAAVGKAIAFQSLPDLYGTGKRADADGPVAIGSIAFSKEQISGTAELVIDGYAPKTLDLHEDVNLDFVVNDGVATMLNDTINPLITKVNEAVTPLSQALGLSLYGADLFAIPRPTCDNPALRG